MGDPNYTNLYPSPHDRRQGDLDDELPPPPPYSPSSIPIAPPISSSDTSSPSAPPAPSLKDPSHVDPYYARYGTMATQPRGHVPAKSASPPPTNPHHSPPQAAASSHTAAPQGDGSSDYPIFHPKRWIPHMQDYDDDEHPSSNKQWFKYGLLVLAIWFIIFNSISIGAVKEDTAGRPFPCLGEGDSPYTWDGLPKPLEFGRGGLSFVVRGKIRNGSVNIMRTFGEAGSIYAVVKTYIGAKVDYDIVRGELTGVVLNLPGDNCAVVDVDILLPKSTAIGGIDTLHLELNNMKIDAITLLDVGSLRFVTTNSGIKLHEGWHGDQLQLQTTNAKIMSSKDLVVRANGNGTIDLATTNGDLEFPATANKPRSVILLTTNGDVSADLVEAQDLVQISTTNGAVGLERATAETVSIQSTNGKLKLPLVQAVKTVSTRTTNSAIYLTVDGAKDPQVDVTTSNGDVEVRMLDKFEGTFSVKTSSGARASVFDPANGLLKFSHLKRHFKQGIRNDGSGDLSITTSNSDIRLTFAN
ncbi:hypothetical protein DFQ28_002877 [Apophysomyces sp. BC1034]|nr:hypothetical protein DFQ30_005494 [Apophysomyces sp. BC1015]KAG0179140.1 hypothetical protein DFQ29_002476 [Apophysomyces sp. BC1021]KAG0189802.1 hypothetical protein DFQ28_002877 [Apophysomyces sp. BC1034]